MAVEELTRLDDMFDQTAFSDPSLARVGGGGNNVVASGSGVGGRGGPSTRGQRRAKPAYLLSNASRDNI